ncbi:MAG: family 2 glycosyl transferase [Planctomycetes bacterium]|nr:family 2 glycosyl transferase [Planctomycetota bacterium]
MLVSLLIPLHDEHDAVGPLFEDLRRLPDLLAPRTLQVVCADDGSTDDTVARLRILAREAPFDVRVAALTPNRGLGAALRDAAPETSGDVVITYDADRPYPLEDIPRLLACLDAGADIATASPWHPDGKSLGVPWHRSFISRAISRLYRLRLGRRASNLHTITCGFRAWRRSTLLDSLPRRDGFVATAEMLIRALRSGARVAEVPSVLRPRTEGRSKMRIIRVAWSHLGLLLLGR